MEGYRFSRATEATIPTCAEQGLASRSRTEGDFLQRLVCPSLAWAASAYFGVSRH